MSENKGNEEKRVEGERQLYEWRKAAELKEIDFFNHPKCVRYDGGGTYCYVTIDSIEELNKLISPPYNTLESGIEYLKSASLTPIQKAVAYQPTTEEIKRWFQLLVGKGEDAMREDMAASLTPIPSINGNDLNLENIKNWQKDAIAYCDNEFKTSQRYGTGNYINDLLDYIDKKVVTPLMETPTKVESISDKEYDK